MPLGLGETFERYSVEALIGRGGMGEVYRATDTRLRRKVALKVIRPDKDRPDAASRLYREARAAAALTHPNAVAVHDVGDSEGVFYIVMELVVGQPLLAFVGDSRVGPLKKIAWLTDIARALGAAHRAGIIHRDVKPANVMISEDGFAKVLDFGLARPLGPIDPVSFRTQEGRVLGTLRYMAPEQVVGVDADARTDQYAFGLTAYELLTGTHPGGGMFDTQPKRADELAPDVPHETALVVERALARDPGKRFETMEDVVHALEASISTQRAPAPHMTPHLLVSAAPTPSTADETRSAEKPLIVMMVPSNTPPAGGLSTAPTLAALAEAGARDAGRPQEKKDASTLISKQAPSAIARAREQLPADKTLPLPALPAPVPAPSTIVSPSSPPPSAHPAVVHIPSAPRPRSAPPHAPSQAPANQRLAIVIVTVTVLAFAAFAGTYLGSRESAQSPTATVTSSAPAPAASSLRATPEEPALPATASVAPIATASSRPPRTPTVPVTAPAPAPAKPKSTAVIVHTR